MADGTTYSIDVQAKDTGVDATSSQVLELSGAIEAAERVLTPFDSALQAASVQLDKASAAADTASSALDTASAQYSRLERASTKASKAVERVAAKGGDTTALQAAASGAAAAVKRQATAVDQARAKAVAATAAQEKLAKAYKTVGRAASKAASSTGETQKSFGDLFGAAGALGGRFGGLAGQISGVGDGLRAGGGKAGVILGAFAAANAFVALTKASVALAVALVGVVAGLLGFAIAADKATSKKLQTAWERAGKSAKRLFEGVKTSKLVKPVESLLKLLDKNTSAGKGLASIFESILNPVIDGIVEATPLAKEFFKGMILGALKAINAVLRMRNAIVGAVPKSVRDKVKKFVDDLIGLTGAAKAGETAFKVLGLVLAVTLIPVVLLGAFFGLVGIAILGMVLAIDDAIVVLESLGKTIDEALDPAAMDRNIAAIGESLAGLGELGVSAVAALINGMVESIKRGEDPVAGAARVIAETIISTVTDILGEQGIAAGKALWQAMVKAIGEGKGPVAGIAKALAESAVNAIKAAIKPGSPSRVTVAIGKTAPQGLVKAMRDGTPDVEAAARDMGSAVGTGASSEISTTSGGQRSGGGAGQRSGGGKTVTVNFSEGSVVIESRGDAESVAKFKQWLLAAMDEAALQLGAGETVGVAA